MLPITHLLYLASGLCVLGLCGMTLRRAPGRVLLGLVLLLVGTWARQFVWAGRELRLRPPRPPCPRRSACSGRATWQA